MAIRDLNEITIFKRQKGDGNPGKEYDSRASGKHLPLRALLSREKSQEDELAGAGAVNGCHFALCAGGKAGR